MGYLKSTFLCCIALLGVAEIRTFRACKAFVRAMVIGVYNLPGIVHCGVLGNLKVLREVCDILDSLGFVHFVVGGLAYDIALGRITRYHKDLDVAVLDDGDMERLVGEFARHGFEIVKIGQKSQLRKKGVMVDLFRYRLSGDGYITTRHEDVLVRIPEQSFYAYRTKWLYGNAYRIASDEHNVCIEPFVKEKGSIGYISELKKRVPITCRQSREQIVETVTVYEYHHEEERSSVPFRKDAISKYKKCA